MDDMSFNIDEINDMSYFQLPQNGSQLWFNYTSFDLTYNTNGRLEILHSSKIYAEEIPGLKL